MVDKNGQKVQGLDVSKALYRSTLLAHHRRRNKMYSWRKILP
ncbi:hypothetical protein Gotur_008770 [Gossypium turneri]